MFHGITQNVIYFPAVYSVDFGVFGVIRYSFLFYYFLHAVDCVVDILPGHIVIGYKSH